MDNLIYECLNNGYKTERLILRKLREEDVIDMFEYTSDEEVCKYLTWGPHKSTLDTKIFIEKTLEKYVNPKDIVWGIEYLKKLIGVVRVYNINFDRKECEISYILNRKFQGKGLMTEAIDAIINVSFSILLLNKVIAFVDKDNINSRNLIVRCNMKKLDESNSILIIKNKYRKFLKYEIVKEVCIE